MAVDRDAWRHLIFKAFSELEEDRRNVPKDKRSKGEVQAASNTTLDVIFTHVDTDHGSAFVPADDMDKMPNLHSRSQAIIIIRLMAKFGGSMWMGTFGLG